MPNTAVAKRQPNQSVARPLKVLVPLIQRELSAGDNAGLEHYRQAGEMLLEAREQVAAFKWSGWLSKNFTLSRTTAWRYMRLAEVADAKPSRFASETTVHGAIGERRSDFNQRTGAFRPVREFTAHVDTDRLGQERQVRDEEMRLHRELALELIDIGFKALATRLHPDRGGSKDAMRRLNRVRDELQGVAETRRFE
jgi:hypothetical protein